MDFHYKLGKKPATRDSRDLCFAQYQTVSTVKFPPLPPKFGHEDLIKVWGMLGNDTVGDCAFAAGAHVSMEQTACGGHPASFDTKGVLSDYSAVTGYNPNDPASDQGTNVRDLLNYWRKVGLVDSTGKRHKIGGYVSIEPGRTTHILEALYLLGPVVTGIQMPDSAQEQFNEDKVWSVAAGAQIEGGHCVPLVAQRTHLECVTWGKIQPMTSRFFDAYCDEVWCVISEEMLVNGKSIEGFNLAQLQADMKALD